MADDLTTEYSYERLPLMEGPMFHMDSRSSVIKKITNHGLVYVLRSDTVHGDEIRWSSKVQVRFYVSVEYTVTIYSHLAGIPNREYTTSYGFLLSYARPMLEPGRHLRSQEYKFSTVHLNRDGPPYGSFVEGSVGGKRIMIYLNSVDQVFGTPKTDVMGAPITHPPKSPTSAMILIAPYGTKIPENVSMEELRQILSTAMKTEIDVREALSHLSPDYPLPLTTKIDPSDIRRI